MPSLFSVGATFVAVCATAWVVRSRYGYYGSNSYDDYEEFYSFKEEEKFELPKCESAENFYSFKEEEKYEPPKCESPEKTLKKRGKKKKKHAGKLKIVIELDEHIPSIAILKYYDQKFKQEILQNISTEFSSFLLSKEITPTNIIPIFEVLLEMEQVAQMSKYVKLAQRNVVVKHELKTESDGYGTCIVDNYYIQMRKNDVLDVILPSDEVLVITNSDLQENQLNCNLDNLFFKSNQCVKGIISTISNKRIDFRIDDLDSKEKIRINMVAGERFCIVFRASYWPLRYQYHALSLLKEEDDLRRNLFDNLGNGFNTSSAQISTKCMNKHILCNPQQLQAVHNIIHNANPKIPYIVFGPPGTGKTTTIVEAIVQLINQKPHSRILVTASTNSACDTIALLLCKYARSDLLNNVQIFRLFSKTVCQNGLSNTEEDLKRISNCNSGKHCYPSIEFLRKYRIVVATLSTVGKLVTGEIGNDHFTHVFIDEASSCTIPETLVGIMGIKSSNCQVVLSGDHKQLGPVLQSNYAAKLGLEQSLMEYLLRSHAAYEVDYFGNYNSAVQTILVRNYRSHPKILEIFNHLYYNNKLQAFAFIDPSLYANWDIIKNPRCPVIFQQVNGVTEIDEKTHSSSNKEELEMIKIYLKSFFEKDGEKVKQSSIGIVTPYNMQCHLIKEMLKKYKWNEIMVGSAEKFQGREKDIIIVSMVRSNISLGFVSCPRRLNVMISRAKSLLIIIGNPDTLAQNTNFKYIIRNCEIHGNFLDKEHNATEFFAGKSVRCIQNQSESSKDKYVVQNLQWQ